MSKWFDWLIKVPSIGDAHRIAREGTMRTHIVIKRYEDADEDLKRLIKQNGFSEVLLYSKGD